MTHSFGQGITGAEPIESSESNSHSYSRLAIDANQIKWFITLIPFLDFDWCLIEVIITLHIIGLLLEAYRMHYFVEPSLMKCKVFHLRRAWVERHSFPSRHELRIVPMAHRVTHSLSLFGHDILELHHPETKPPTPWAWSSVLIHHKINSCPCYLRDLSSFMWSRYESCNHLRAAHHKCLWDGWFWFCFS